MEFTVRENCPARRARRRYFSRAGDLLEARSAASFDLEGGTSRELVLRPCCTELPLAGRNRLRNRAN